MKKNKILYALVAVVFVGLLAAAAVFYDDLSAQYAQDAVTSQQSSPGQAGQLVSAPDFSVEDRDGNPVSLSDYLGTPVVLNFWASWCGPCASEMPHFQAAYEEYGEDVHFLMVNMSDPFGDPRTDSDEFLTGGGYSFPVYYDTLAECAYGYGVTGIPMTFFIDKNGNLVSGKTGMISEADLQRRILTILD